MNSTTGYAAAVKATVKRARIPQPHKDLNDWTRAGAITDDLVNALAKGETLCAPVQPRSLGKLLDAICEFVRRLFHLFFLGCCLRGRSNLKAEDFLDAQRVHASLE